MDYLNKLERRKEYNRGKNTLQRKQREVLRQFAAEHPERYKELLAKVAAEQERTETLRDLPTASDVTANPEQVQRIHELIRQSHSNIRDWIITAKDAYGGEHTLFLGFPIGHTPQPGDKIETPIKHEPYTVVDATPCTCPLCQ